jgi:uncharacterized protein (TIGR02266 family)
MMTTEIEMSEPQASGNERRRNPRKALCTTLGFLSDTNFYAGFTEDISEGGLFVATHALLELGTEIELEFALPSGHEIRTKGIVRWLRDPHDHTPDAPPGMGIQFQDLAEKDFAIIREFIALREPLFYEA